MEVSLESSITLNQSYQIYVIIVKRIQNKGKHSFDVICGPNKLTELRDSTLPTSILTRFRQYGLSSILHNMNLVKTSSVLYSIKKLIEFGLLIGFLILSILAVNDVFSNQTTYLVSREYKNASLPSFTVCPHGYETTFLNASSLANCAMQKKLPFPMSITTHLQSKENGKYTAIDLLNSTQLKNYFNTTFEDTWTYHCKIYPATSTDSCLPCITFRNPDLPEDVELTTVMF